MTISNYLSWIKNILLFKLSLFIWLLLPYLSAKAQNDSSVIILMHANVIDGISMKPSKDVSVLIKKGKITDIKKHFIKPGESDVVIDLTNKWVLPGYIDAHAHFLNFDAARAALKSGVTTARTLRCSHFVDIKIREAHQAGQFDLPDVVAAGYHIRPDMAKEFYEDFPDLVDIGPKVSGTENVRRIVRAMVSRKVDWIKVLATEKAGTAETDPLRRTFTNEELAAIVDEANKAGLPVAAHAHGDEGAAAAVRAGVRSIEHGTYLSDQTLILMKSEGTYFDQTLGVWTASLLVNPDLYNNKILLTRIQNFSKHGRVVTAHAYKDGILIIGGTDSEYDSDLNNVISDEAIIMVEIGISPMEAIKAITSNSAKCLKIDSHTGAIKIGLDADMVIVDRNPLVDISALKSIQMVINDGSIVINKLHQ